MDSTPTPAEPDISPVPDLSGHFGVFGGRFAPESLMAALEQLTKEYEAARTDPDYTAELTDLLRNYAARPTLVTEAKRFGKKYAGGARVLDVCSQDRAERVSDEFEAVLALVDAEIE